MENLPIEIIQNHIFPHLIYHSKNDLKLFLKKYTLVSKKWKDMIICIDFINYLYKHFKILRPENIQQKIARDRIHSLIKSIYINDITLEQRIIRQENRQIKVTEEILINGYIEKIELIQDINNMTLFKNLKAYDMSINIKLYFELPTNLNSFDRYKMILEVKDDNISLSETVFSSISMDNYNLKIYGNCNIQKNDTIIINIINQLAI